MGSGPFGVQTRTRTVMVPLSCSLHSTWTESTNCSSPRRRMRCRTVKEASVAGTDSDIAPLTLHFTRKAAGRPSGIVRSSTKSIEFGGSESFLNAASFGRVKSFAMVVLPGFWIAAFSPQQALVSPPAVMLHGLFSLSYHFILPCVYLLSHPRSSRFLHVWQVLRLSNARFNSSLRGPRASSLCLSPRQENIAKIHHSSRVTVSKGVAEKFPISWPPFLT